MTKQKNFGSLWLMPCKTQTKTEKKYLVIVKCDGTLPDDPYFQGKTGNAYPNFICEVSAPDEWKARTRALMQYPNKLRGERVTYFVQELTPCCDAYSTYYETELVCEVCYELV